MKECAAWISPAKDRGFHKTWSMGKLLFPASGVKGIYLGSAFISSKPCGEMPKASATRLKKANIAVT